MNTKIIDIKQYNYSYAFVSNSDLNNIYDNVIKRKIIDTKDKIVLDFKNLDIVSKHLIGDLIDKICIQLGDYKAIERISFKFNKYTEIKDKDIKNFINSSQKKRKDYEDYIKEHPECAHWLKP